MTEPRSKKPYAMKNRRPRAELVCKHCGNVFYENQSNIERGRGTYCGKPCAAAERRRPPEERFWNFVQKSDGCWEWTGAQTPNGHGQLRLSRNRNSLAHRFSWELHHGPIPEGLNVCHHCDNPKCVRPDHLFLGDQRANMQDAKAKGRTRTGASIYPERLPHGERHHASKLTEEQVRAIRARHALGVTRAVLAIEYGVSNWTIGEILKGRAWKHVE
jgi:hypothetical protein